MIHVGGRKRMLYFIKNNVLNYLNKHVGERMLMDDLIERSGACCGLSKELIDEKIFDIDSQIREFAEENGYRLNSHHHDNHIWGMPWVYDFYIEIADVRKDVERLLATPDLKKRIMMVEEEYGIYDEEGLLIGFRLSIPGEVKMIYDDACDIIEKMEVRDSD